ncbi:MAG TPA: CHAD domain-containing protein [Devosia sp.]|nr:CHAD domain-containing protein [Devosia sp.]
MALKFDRSHGTAAAIRHIARGEIDDALEAIGKLEDDPARAVHAARQRLKRLRALLRLARGHFRHFSDENAAFRDLGRKLSAMREADVLGETFDTVLKEGELGPLPGLRQALLAAHPGRNNESGRDVLLHETRPGLEAARKRVDDWQFAAHGFALLGEGVEDTFRSMRAAGLEAQAFADPEHLHEWRKQVKYHAAQLRYLQPVAPEWLGPRRQTADRLADVLGDHHDLDMLAKALAELPAECGDDAGRLAGPGAARRGRLETEAFHLRERLADITPAVFRERLEQAWDIWRG